MVALKRTFGPIVTQTASAKMSTPFSISERTSAPKRTSLAIKRLWSKLPVGFASLENLCMMIFKGRVLLQDAVLSARGDQMQNVSK